MLLGEVIGLELTHLLLKFGTLNVAGPLMLDPFLLETLEQSASVSK